MTAPGSLALRTQPRGDDTFMQAAADNGHVLEREHQRQIEMQTDQGGSSAPPKPEDYKHLFESLWNMERRTAEEMPPQVQLALGVFTMPAEQPYRNVIRNTWWKQRGACLLQQGQQDGCSVYTAFVVGSKGEGRMRGEERHELEDSVVGDPRQEEGMLILTNVTENLNDGKTFWYFKTIVEEYSWITHVAKCDIDTYPALHKLTWKIYTQTQCEGSPYVYAGKPESCHSWYMDRCNGFLPVDFAHTCSPPIDGCLARNGQGIEAEGLFSFNFGQLYILSAPLVKEIAVPGGVWEKPPVVTHEDQTTSFAIQRFVTNRVAKEVRLEDGTRVPLKVSILSARGLRDADWKFGSGSSDPYVTFEVAGKPHSRLRTPQVSAHRMTGKKQHELSEAEQAEEAKELIRQETERVWQRRAVQLEVDRQQRSRFKTQVVNNSLAPVWNHTTELKDYVVGDSLTFSVYDKDKGDKHEFLGTATLKKELFHPDGFEGELRLEFAGVRAKAFLKVSIAPARVSKPDQTCVSVYNPEAWCHGVRYCAEVTNETFNDF